MMNTKKKNDPIQTNEIGIYFFSALAVALIGIVTPLINFPIGVAGFIVLVQWLIFAVFNMIEHWHLSKLFTIIFVLVASWRLLYIALVYAFFNLPCWLGECNWSWLSGV